MGIYDLNKAQRLQVVEKINRDIFADIQKERHYNIIHYFSDDDTYIRKTAYQAIGKMWKQNLNLQSKILKQLNAFIKSANEKVRQTTINAAGEIGTREFEIVEHFFNSGLFDEHHSVRNAVIGSVKKWAKKIPTRFEVGEKIFASPGQGSPAANLSRH